MNSSNVFSGEGGGPVQAGVGIFFQQEGDGSVVVKTIVSGGSAEREGSVRVGDQILSVDEHKVVGEPLSVLRGLILGSQGSFVKLTFQRKDMGEAHTFDVRLMRGSAEYLQSLTSSKTIEDEIDQLRLQLRQALSHCSQDRDELDRLRKMLQTERDQSQMRERELELLQQENARELAQLNENLRNAEGGRREAETQLHPLQQREADLAEELNRQKEKERLRKEYIEELKKRHEEEKVRLEGLFLKEQAGRREDQVARLGGESQLGRIQAELSRLRTLEQGRREREEEYKDRMQQELARLQDAVRTQDVVRSAVKEVEVKMARYTGEYLQYTQQLVPPEEALDDDNLFLA
uniref:PDZ domain-containing protein n=2 Tax=Hemiselmis andersenii TaxID=464988 RepID=A0A6T8JUY2_HEMAN